VTTINERIAEARHRLLSAGIDHDEAALDARLLAQGVLGWDAAKLLTAAGMTEPPAFAAQYSELVDRRAHREPLAYITGTREFWNLSFEVSPAVLIPRPETEGLVEAVIELFPAQGERLEVADICTGSGCVAVAVAVERPHAHVIATDNSVAALDVARGNVTRHRLADRVDLLNGDLLAPLGAPVDVIVANPPYVRDRDWNQLPPEVRDFEPQTALFAGIDGLDVIRRLVSGAPALLTVNGYLIFEFGTGQEAPIRELISASDRLKMIAIKADLQGIPRVAVTRRT
jgi:release factor glutamine methyltransferase